MVVEKENLEEYKYMAKELNAKCKKCRRAGEKLFLKGERCNSQKCGVIKRNYPPGIHGPRMGKFQKITDIIGKQINSKLIKKRKKNN